MDAQRLAECNELAESAEDPMDRLDFEGYKQPEWYGSYTSAEYDAENLEMWRRVLSASIQPPPSVAERPIMRSVVDPKWLRETYRGTREDIRRLLRPSHQKSRSGSTSLLSALERRDPTKLESDDAAAASERAAPQEVPEGARVPLRVRR